MIKINFLKFKNKSLPPLKSLRPQIFDVNFLWFLALGLFFVIIIINGLIGFKLSYTQYFGSFKELKSVENFENLINIDRLKNAILKRDSFINKEISLPRDPSL